MTRILNSLSLLIFLLISQNAVQAQTTSLGGIINSYAKVTSIGQLSVTIGQPALANNISLTEAFGPGKQVMIYQTKGARIETQNTPSFGEIIAYGNAGNYEIAEVSSILAISGGYQINFTAMMRTYDVENMVQLISFPHYQDAKITQTLTALDWDPILGYGGVLAFEVENDLNLRADIDVSGKGFRGGVTNSYNYAGATVSNQYRVDVSAHYSGKGESIADADYNGISGLTYGRGAMANGGGGGSSHNGGGGGGGNLTRGGKGGIGGLGAGLAPGSAPDGGGLRGNSLDYVAVENRIFFGGGGGGGQQNNRLSSRGGNGGGIVLIKANRLKIPSDRNHGIYALGENGPNSTGNDGAGGGGGGGVVVLDLESVRRPSQITIDTRGGHGGTVMHAHQHGAGGGGGMGVVLLNTDSEMNMNILNISGTKGQDCINCSSTDTAEDGGDFSTAQIVINEPVVINWPVETVFNALPVQIVDLQAEAKPSYNEITWTSSNTQRVSHFEVERSYDGQRVESMAQQALQSDSSVQVFAYSDYSLQNGTVYYRVKTVLLNGSVLRSEWMSLAREEGIQVSVYPNPSTDFIQVSLNEPAQEDTKACILQLDGQVLETIDVNDKQSVNVSNYPRGWYVLVVNHGGKEFIKKIRFE